MRRDRRYIALLLLAVAALVALQLLAPQPLDWRLSLAADDTRPHGSRVLYEQLPDLLGVSDVRRVAEPPYLVLQDTAARGVRYLFLTHTFAPDRAEAEALLRFVARGNTVFVSAAAVAGPLADTLGLATAEGLRLPLLGADGRLLATLPEESVTMVAPALRRAYRYPYFAVAAHLAAVDTAAAVVLGVAEGGAVNYIQQPHGAGAFLVHTAPMAFTNYHLLKPERVGYAAAVLAALPPSPTVWWDAHYKPLRNTAATPLRFVLADPALRWAYGVLMATLLLFLGFRARRRQRPIPVVRPLQNTSLAFVQTVGRLYYQHGDHRDLAQKQIAFFLDDLRTSLRVATTPLDDALAEQVAERSGVPVAEVRALFALLTHLQNTTAVIEPDLQRLQAALQRFHQQRLR